jgi:predicted MFS family arabinose efflux permease
LRFVRNPLRYIPRRESIAYLSELRTNWRPLLAATIGLGTGMSLIGIVISTMAPSLISGNGWSVSDFAMVGSLGLFSSLALPFVGRLADVLGVRRTALIGQVAMPLTYLAYSQMDGSIGVYIGIFIAQSIICMTTTATVYARLAVQYVTQARGLALAIVASGPALFGIVVGPVLNAYVEAEGWRSGYQALAMFAVISGIITFLLIPAEPKGDNVAAKPRRKASEDYPAIFRNGAFWVLAAAMLLCNLPQTILQAQLKMLMLENGVDGRAVGAMLSAASLGMLSGRILTGLAIDRFNPYWVGFLTMGLPSLGLFMISTSLDDPALLWGAVYFLGFTYGAEGDVVAYLVARRFGVRIYSSVMGLMTACMSASTALGATLLSVTLAATGNFNLFLLIVGTAVVTGAALLLLLGRSEQGQVAEA